MRKVCLEYADATDLGAGQYQTRTGLVIPAALFTIASTFVALQDARIQADYNLGMTVTHAQAGASVGQVETAFAGLVHRFGH